MLALCLMLSMTHYAQNYAGIIGGSLCMCIHIVPILTESILNNNQQMFGWKGCPKDNLSMAFLKEPYGLI